LDLLADLLTSIGPVIPVFSRRLSMAADVASVQFSRTVERRIRRPMVGSCGRAHLRVCPTTGGRRSLKTQQHAGVVADLRYLASK